MDRQFIEQGLELEWMENTQSVLFEDDTPKWYVALGDRWQGPLTASEVYSKVESKEISMAHYVWTPGQSGWQRICDLKAFNVVVPTLPQKNVLSEVETAAKPVIRPSARSHSRAKAPTPPIAPEAKEWFLYYSDSQFGPFTRTEIVGFIKSGRVKDQPNAPVYAWKDGMKNWEGLDSLKEFKSVEVASQTLKAPAPPVASRVKADHRQAPRKPMVAKILLAANDDIIVGICRDVSIGGMQVLADRVPGRVGTKLKLNVSPTSKTEKSFHAFTAQGTIVRVLEDGRGFSFRFEPLNQTAKKSIEDYITQD